jgi:hydroxymethylpyrimidine pyrophosphatase-like HAD family hydrolase
MLATNATIPERYFTFKKAVITDLDDTIFPKRPNEKGLSIPVLPPETQQYLAIDATHFPADAALIGSTGRTAGSVKKLAEQLGEEPLNSIRSFDGLMVLNGAVLYLNQDEDHEGKPFKNAEFFKKLGKHQLPTFHPYNAYLGAATGSSNAKEWSSTQLVEDVCQWLIKQHATPVTVEEYGEDTQQFKAVFTEIQKNRQDAPKIKRLLIATVERANLTEHSTFNEGKLPKREAQFAIVFFKDGKEAVDPKPMIIAVPAFKKKPTLFRNDDFSAVENLVLTAFQRFTVGDEQIEPAYPTASVELNKKRATLENHPLYGLTTPTNRSYIEATPYNKGQAVEALLATLLPNVVKVVTLGDAENDRAMLSPASYEIETRTMPNAGVVIQLPNTPSNQLFLSSLGIEAGEEVGTHSHQLPHLQLQTPETWSAGVKHGLLVD